MCKPLLLLCVTLGLSTAALAQTAPPSQAPATNTTRVGEILAWFGWGELTEIFRGGSAPGSDELGALEIWVMNANGAHPHRFVADRGYRTPVFAPDGRRLAAIRAGKLRILRFADRRSGTDRDLSIAANPAYLLGWTQKGIAVFTDESNVVAVDPETGDLMTIAQNVSEPEFDNLVAASHTCGSTTVAQAYLPGFAYAVPARYDIGVRAAASDTAKLLTEKSSRRINAEPAFSADCKRIVFISK